MGPKAVCMPAIKKLSQLKASRLCRDGAASFSRDSGSTTLIAVRVQTSRERVSRAGPSQTSRGARNEECVATCQFPLPCITAAIEFFFGSQVPRHAGYSSCLNPSRSAAFLFSSERATGGHPARMPTHHFQGKHLGRGTTLRCQVECRLADRGGKIFRH